MSIASFSSDILKIAVFDSLEAIKQPTNSENNYTLMFIKLLFCKIEIWKTAPQQRSNYRESYMTLQ